MLTKTVKIVLILAGVVIVVIIVVVPLAIHLMRRKKVDSSKGCSIDPFEADPYPLIVLANTNTFLYPNPGEKILRFKVNQRVDFICPGGGVNVGSLETDNGVLTGTCKKGTSFKIKRKTLDSSEIRCRTPILRDIRATGNRCSWFDRGQELEVGFIVEDGRFLRTLSICFNQAKQLSEFTYIEQTPSINQQILGTPRPPWLQGSGIYNIKGTISNLYLKKNQRTTINRLLGLPDKSTKYIKNTGDYFLARGHLTARSDFFYAAQQNATFYMQNIAPQWQTFNSRNWNQIEADVRNYAAASGVNLHVWTGVHGITTLPHEKTGLPTQLYLFVNETSKLIPVPEIFWKAVYNPKTERGVCLIGVNNPYQETFSPICPDISKDIDWLHCDRTSQKRGFCYACNLTAIRFAMPILPRITDRGLLL
ncbi:unnamed protein product [Ceutorhynchus assimilis]|uniref:DNA/RNA non-specific endonuclease/pyrophosphatase/phosphodiesterase domain-containing protein n=1 Tax=Ceutorhynchus assimilis TaxID=467358 RepID=A0A9N9MQM7_9CUCU|nr:unnamed protein product [Ceutorhynchus assimilis]